MDYIMILAISLLVIGIVLVYSNNMREVVIQVPLVQLVPNYQEVSTYDSHFFSIDFDTSRTNAEILITFKEDFAHVSVVVDTSRGVVMSKEFDNVSAGDTISLDTPPLSQDVAPVVLLITLRKG